MIVVVVLVVVVVVVFDLVSMLCILSSSSFRGHRHEHRGKRSVMMNDERGCNSRMTTKHEQTRTR